MVGGGVTGPELVPQASVIVPTRNGMPLVERCLRSVLAQETPWPYEVIVIDSESTDGTWELAESLKVERIRIRPQSFNHGATRNLGASRTRGQYIAFLVQDAVPADHTWLRRLVEASGLPGVAGSYSRELPWPSDHPMIRLHMRHTLPQHQERALQGLESGQSWRQMSPAEKLALARFHNTSSCIRRQAWAEHPFGTLRYGEDLDWGARVIQAGYTLVYEPRAAVYHSHDRPSWYEMRRAYADHDLVMRLFGYCAYPRLMGLAASWLSFSWKSMRLVWSGPGSPGEKAFLLLRVPVIIGARHCGSYIGARAGQRRSGDVFVRLFDSILRKNV